MTVERSATPRPERPRRREALATAILVAVIAVIPAAMEPRFAFDRWDNREFWIASIAAAHRQWLDGAVPSVNLDQHLGEPFFGRLEPAPLYPPYTVAVAATDAIGGGVDTLALLIAWSHLAFAGWGWHRLMRRLGTTSWTARLTAIAAALGGFSIAIGSAWIAVLVVSAWIPWLLAATVDLVGRPDARGVPLALGGALALVVAAGQPQLALYVWLFVGLFGVGYTVIVEHAWRRLARLAAVFVGASMASTAVWWPGLRYLATTVRGQSASVDASLARAASPWSLVDMLLPVFDYWNGFFAGGASVFLHQAGWIVPAILAAAIGPLRLATAPVNEADARRRRLFWLSVGLAGLFLLLSFGRSGRLLPLFWGLPVWSSFREPFRFLPAALAAIVVAAGLALDALGRGGRTRRTDLLVAFTIVGSLALLAGNRALGTPLAAFDPWVGPFAAVLALSAMAIPAAATRPPLRSAATVIAILASVAFGVLVHATTRGGHSEPPGLATADTLGLEPGFRVAPLSSVVPGTDHPFEALGLFHAATINDYESVTGHHPEGLLAADLLEAVPSEVTGAIEAEAQPELVGGELLRGLGVRYYVAAAGDERAAALARTARFRLHRQLDSSVVWEDPWARSPVRIEPPNGWSLSWGRERGGLRIDATGDRAATLVVAIFCGDGWTATVDGEPTELGPRVGLACTVALPAGAHRLRLRYRTPGLAAGLVGSALGLTVLALPLVVRRRSW